MKTVHLQIEDFGRRLTCPEFILISKGLKRLDLIGSLNLHGITKLGWGSVFAIIFVSLAASANAKVKVKTSKSYYTISGNNGKSLNYSMLKGGRKNIRLSDAIAATETKIDIGDPKIAIENGKCIVKKIDVVLHIRYTYPNWKNKKGASKTVRNSWEKFRRELVRHEENHGKIAKLGAKALEKELLKMNGNVAIKCANFGSLAAFKLRNLTRKTARAQRAFDRKEQSRFSKITKLQKDLFRAK